ncbi:flagellar hook-basal body protein [Aureibacillus halotolerans]|uniref:Flagellar basal-body rod protein FlgG n=1 Tax=Aureibacillus halotolerans TaxID=1508390 RepID=A0A4R6U1Z3_9BACI|nr:flagellar hook-basal body protein [Aureibacillus halotolerans]TDQ38703.1 flagellar basal-body rod protein FlgG [Aureibacillus halotolerans]
MFKGFNTAASAMIAQQRHTEMLSNNLANVNTPGYKSDQGVLRAFPEMLLQRIGGQSVPGLDRTLPTTTPIGALNTGVYLQETIPQFTQGDIQETNRFSDLALVQAALPDENGAVFFAVQNEAGEPRYTRNGSFHVDDNGSLVNAEGRFVLSAASEQIQLASGTFTVSEDGVITDAAGNATALNIAYSAAPQEELVREGTGLYRADGAALGQAPAGFIVRQGALERSSVDLNETMVNMMSSYRLFEASQRVVKAYDESMGKAVNDVGRIG